MVDTSPARAAVEGRLWDRYVGSTRDRTNREALETLAADDRRAADGQVATVLLVGAACLVFIEYFGRSSSPEWLLTTMRGVGLGGLAGTFEEAMLTSAHAEFWGLVFWSGVRVVAYAVVPLLVARRFLGLGARDIGLRIRGIRHHAPIYLALFVAAAPFIAIASFGDDFQVKYPFYDPLPGEGLWPYVMAWWIAYGIQFVGVEIFFRGFLVLGLAPRFGFAAVFVAVVPYVMIHFGKPLPETCGAVLTGLALGVLVLKYRSIWWGAALHIAAALTLDVLALGHEGFF